MLILSNIKDIYMLIIPNIKGNIEASNIYNSRPPASLFSMTSDVRNKLVLLPKFFYAIITEINPIRLPDMWTIIANA